MKPNQANQKKMVAVYARVSTSNQENEGTIETQLSAVREYAEEHGLFIVKEYLDQGWSGATLARPELDQLRVDAKKGLWEAVLIYDPDRLARKFSYQELISDELREAGLDILYVTTSTPENSEDRILFGVKGLFAEYERSKIAERFRLGKLRKAKEGHIIMTTPPYGYDFVAKQGSRANNDLKQGHLKINQFEARILKMIFEWIANEGLTLRKVISRLHQMKVKPKKSSRGVWSTSTLSTLLRNRTYIGEGHYGASYGVVPKNPHTQTTYKRNKKTSRKMKPKEEWIIIPTPKIIDTELFDAVDIQLQKNSRTARRNRKNEYLLAGNIWCTCGQRRTGEGPQGGKYLYYRCSGRVCSFPLKSNCTEKGINARNADQLVWANITAFMTSPDLMKSEMLRWRSGKKTKRLETNGNLDEINKEISKLRGQERRYDRAFGEGLLSLSQLKEYKEPLWARIKVLQQETSRFERQFHDKDEILLPGEKEVDEFSQIAKEKVSNLNFEARKAIVERVVESIVGTQKQLVVKGHLPFSFSELYSRLCSNHDSEDGRIPSNFKINHVKFQTNHRNGSNESEQMYSLSKRIPFELIIELPPPLRRGIDYGFKKTD